MNFSSIREYFYKLNSRCYIFVLVPLAAFIFIYFYREERKALPPIQDAWIGQIILIGACLITLINLTTVHWLSRKRLRTYALLVGLGNKLDKYYEIILLRFNASCITALLMAVGALLTENENFGFCFIIILLWMALQWPTSRKACRELELKGDEYEMVFYKKESF